MTPPCGSGKCEHAVANGVLYRIYLDMITGVVPAGRIETFADLHDCVDANMYFIEVAGDVPLCEDADQCIDCEAYYQLINAAQDLAAQVVQTGHIQRQAISLLN